MIGAPIGGVPIGGALNVDGNIYTQELTATLTTSAVLTWTLTRAQLLTATLTTSATMSRAIAKTMAATLTATGLLQKAIAKTLSAAVTVTAVLTTLFSVFKRPRSMRSNLRAGRGNSSLRVGRGTSEVDD